MRDPRLTRGEYWLMETVVEHAVPLAFLWGYRSEEIFNKPGHCLSRRGLVGGLRRLSVRGLIEFLRFVGDREVPFAPTGEEIETSLDEQGPGGSPSCCYYRLTADGGAVWEAFARPDWSRYISQQGTGPGRGKWEAGYCLCADRARLQRYLDGLHWVGLIVDPDSVEWGTIRPWRATYWKELPTAYTVSFRRREDAPGPESRARDEFLHWYTYVYSARWYSWR